MIRLSLILLFALCLIGASPSYSLADEPVQTEIIHSTTPDSTTTFGWSSPDNPRGVVIFIHGGGWFGDRSPSMHSGIPKYYHDKGPDQGWAVLSVAYRSGFDASQADVQEAYRIAREKVGRYKPVCSLGVSAGGHLSLMLSIEEQNLDCAVSEGGIVDLIDTRESTQKLIDFWFGENPDPNLLKNLSPVYRFEDESLSETKTRRVLMGTVADDGFANIDRLIDTQNVININGGDSELHILDPDPNGTPFIHSVATRESVESYQKSLNWFLRAAEIRRSNLFKVIRVGKQQKVIKIKLQRFKNKNVFPKFPRNAFRNLRTKLRKLQDEKLYLRTNLPN